MSFQDGNNLRLCEFTVDLQGLVGFSTILVYATTTGTKPTQINDGSGGWFFWSATATNPQDGNVNVVDPYNGRGPVGRWLRATAGTTSVTLTGDVVGSGTGTVVTNLALQSLTSGTYNNVQINQKGIVTSATNVAYISGNQIISVTGFATGSGATSIVTSQAAAVTLGSWTTGNLPVSQLGSGAGASSTTLYHGDQTWRAVVLNSDVTGTLQVTAFNAGSSASSSTFLRGDGVWQIPPGASGSGVTSILITSPDIVVSPTTPQTGAASFAIALTTSAAVIGSFKSPNITVSGDGRINVISNADDAVPMHFSGTMANSTELSAIYAYAVQYTTSLTGSFAFTQFTPANMAVFTINKMSNASLVPVGSVTFTSAQSGTFTWTSSLSFTPGNLLQVVSPTSADASLANTSFTFFGTRL